MHLKNRFFKGTIDLDIVNNGTYINEDKLIEKFNNLKIDIIFGLKGTVQNIVLSKKDIRYFIEATIIQIDFHKI